MAMQFGRDERTGQLGYWDGQKFIPLQQVQEQSGQANIADIARDPTVTGVRFENISPADKAAVQAQMRQGQRASVPTLPGAPLPQQRSAELAQSAETANVASQDPQYRAETQQIGKESLPELVKFAAANVAPAVLSGGGTAAASAAIKGGGLLARLARMSAGGGGGYLGEKINQAIGLSEGDEGTALVSAGLGAVPGFKKPSVKSLTSDERRIQRLVGGEEVSTKAGVIKQAGEDYYKLARAGGDISTDALLKPLDDLMMSAKTTPNIGGTVQGEAFLRKLEALRETLVKRVLEIKRTRSIKVGGQEAIEQGAGVPAGIVGKDVASRTELATAEEATRGKKLSTQLRTPFARLFEKAQAAKAGAEVGGAAAIPKTKVTGMEIKAGEAPKQISPENLVDDLKQLTNQKGLYREAENLGIPGLTQKLKATYQAMAKEVPNLPEGDLAYGQGKALERGAKATRAGGAVGVENLLADPKLSGGLTPAQKVFLKDQAAKSDKIGRITQALMQSPLGRSLLRSGVSEKGIAKPAAWSAALQIGARMAGLGEGEQSEAPTSTTAY
jgi:hypothetical protein